MMCSLPHCEFCDAHEAAKDCRMRAANIGAETLSLAVLKMTYQYRLRIFPDWRHGDYQ